MQRKQRQCREHNILKMQKQQQKRKHLINVLKEKKNKLPQENKKKY